MAEPIIRLEDVRFRYEPMLMVFDLAVERDTFVALIGASGSGKTTLLNLIAGFDQPDSGRVLLDGRDMTSTPPAGRPVTTLFQEHNLFPHLTVAQNVGLGRHPGLRLGAEDRRVVADALARVGLEGQERKLPGQLSGGERQRVALARTLVRNRPVLLLDEPFAALGPALRREMVDLVLTLRREHGLTIVMVTHQPEDIVDPATRTLLLEDGRIVADGAFGALQADASPALVRYLGQPT